MQACELLASIGLDLSVRSYPAGQPLRDAAHIALLERFRTRLHSSLAWRTEVPVAASGDVRAWDAVVQGAGWRMAVEAETRLRDWQALERRIALKLRDGSVDGVVLLVWNTKGNRAALRALGPSAVASLPVPGRRALELLKVGVSPGGGALVVL